MTGMIYSAKTKGRRSYGSDSECRLGMDADGTKDLILVGDHLAAQN